MKILAVESSCDDTSVAIVENGYHVLSVVTASQDRFHEVFKGVVPEIASRKHFEVIVPLISEVFNQSGLTHSDIDAVAVTTRPGLVGSLLVGISAAKMFAYIYKKPFIPVNHLYAHVHSLGLMQKMRYPLICTVVSGGHTILTKVFSPLKIETLGMSLDDACGEAFDKVAKFYGLGYPGGPAVDHAARNGQGGRLEFPSAGLPNKDEKYSFSYSGLKTAVIYNVNRYMKKKTPEHLRSREGSPEIADILLAFEKAALDPLIHKSITAAKEFQIKDIAFVGGVSANSYLRETAKREAQNHNLELHFPKKAYTTDNAAMVAAAAFYQYPFYKNYHYFYAAPNPRTKGNPDAFA